MNNSSNNQKNMLTFSASKTGKMIEEFCELTSLHGFSFMYKAKNITVKMIWIIAIISVRYFLIVNVDRANTGSS